MPIIIENRQTGEVREIPSPAEQTIINHISNYVRKEVMTKRNIEFSGEVGTMSRGRKGSIYRCTVHKHKSWKYWNKKARKSWARHSKRIERTPNVKTAGVSIRREVEKQMEDWLDGIMDIGEGAFYSDEENRKPYNRTPEDEWMEEFEKEEGEEC